MSDLLAAGKTTPMFVQTSSWENAGHLSRDWREIYETVI
jgi:hypothetical protein